MNVLKGIYLVIWILIGIIVLTSLVGGLMFATSGGFQKIGDNISTQVQQATGGDKSQDSSGSGNGTGNGTGSGNGSGNGSTSNGIVPSSTATH